jgi:hypothetical protein
MSTRVALRVVVLPVVLLVCAFATVAAAAVGKRRIALVGADATLLHSVAIALSAWDIEVVCAPGPSPGSSLPGAQQNAAAIARSEEAKVVVWVGQSDATSALWIYDARTKQLASRVLGDRPPFDEPSAAAVALSLKALLRSSAVAPEDGGATSPSAAPSVLWIEGQAGVRLWSFPEPRGALGLAIWPHETRDHLGFGLVASVGPGLHVMSPSTDAHFMDVALSPSLRTGVRIGARLLLEPSLGATIHFTSFEGTVAQDAVLWVDRQRSPILARRLDGSIDAALAFEARMGTIRLGALAHAGFLPSYQRYSVRDEVVFALVPFSMDFALRVGVGLL